MSDNQVRLARRQTQDKRKVLRTGSDAPREQFALSLELRQRIQAGQNGFLHHLDELFMGLGKQLASSERSGHQVEHFRVSSTGIARFPYSAPRSRIRATQRSYIADTGIGKTNASEALSFQPLS